MCNVLKNKNYSSNHQSAIGLITNTAKEVINKIAIGIIKYIV